MARRWLRAALLLVTVAAAWALPAAGRSASSASADPWRRLQAEYMKDLRAGRAAALSRGGEQLAGALAAAEAPSLQAMRRDVFAHLAAEFSRLTPGRPSYPGQVPAALALAVATRRAGSRDAQDLGTAAFARAIDLLTTGNAAQSAAGLAEYASAWVEAEPTEETIRALTAVLPDVPAGGGETRTIVLTRLGNALAHLGRKQEAIARFQEAVAQPKLDWWPEGHMAARDAFAAWARVEPDVALAKANAQLGGYHDVWSGPELLTSYVTATAAETIAKTDLPRAMQMVRTAPRTEWSLGGVPDTRGRAMLTLAGAIAGRHPREAEQLIGEAFAALRPYLMEVLPAVDALPMARRRAWLAKLCPGYARTADVAGSGLLDVREPSELRLLMRADPTLLPRLVKAWGRLLPREGTARHGRETNNPALTGLASAAIGREYLQAGNLDADLAAGQLVMWIDLAYAVEVSQARRSSPRYSPDASAISRRPFAVRSA